MHNSMILLAFWCLIRHCHAISPIMDVLEPFSKRSLPSPMDCYDWKGSTFGNNYQCPNSFTCCNSTAICLPNRLCIGSGVLIRPTCSVYPWDNQTCAQICQYETGTGLLPRVTMCEDGSYCCDNDPECCTMKRGAFLNSSGHIVSAPSASLATAASTIVLSTSILSTATITSASTESKGMPAGEKGAIGALVAIVVLVAIGAGFILWKRKRRPAQNGNSQSLAMQYGAQNLSGYPQEPPGNRNGINFGLHEIGDDPRPKFSELESRPRA